MFSSRQVGPRPISLPASTGSGSGMVVVILLLLVGMGRSHLGAQDRQLKLKSPGSPPLTARATFTDQPIKIDGKLDEEAWKQAQVLKDFIQNQPRTGEPASEPTEVRILFDNDNLYFGAFCFDSEISKRTVPSLERDFSPGPLHDLFAFALDTFHDGRNSYGFAVNPPGAKHEGQFYNDGRVFNVDFDAVWHVATTVGKDRWTAEFAIPFSSMRFKKGVAQTWGINFLRVVRRKGETSFWAQLPYRYSLGRVSRAGTLVGIEDVVPGRSLKITPYVQSRFRSSAQQENGTTTDIEAGVDVKYGLTNGLNLDLTYNTDFSDVEVDTQQVNLTRFSLFFPEKRPFFLENRGFFFFGQSQALSFRDPGFRATGSQVRRRGSVDRDFIPFFSRRVGLSDAGVPVPILWGARLSGREGPYELGALFIQEEETQDAGRRGFTVIRAARSFSENARLGAIFVDRVAGTLGEHNRIYGVDTNIRLLRHLNIDAMLAGSQKPGDNGDSLTWKAQASWRDQFWDLNQSYIDIGDDVQAAAGFVPRTGIRKSVTQVGIHPRPGRGSRIREFFPHAQVEYIMNQQNQLQTRVLHWGFGTTFTNNAQFEVSRTETFERLQTPFAIRSDVSIAGGDYRFSEWSALFSLDTSRPWSVNLRHDRGDFFNGEKTTYQLGAVFRRRPHFYTEVSYQRNEVSLPAGDFELDLVGLRLHYGFNISLFFDGLIQYNTDTRTINSNLRLNLIHRPLSNLYLVYNDNRNSWDRSIQDRSLALKLTYLWEP